jgi:hypothetical protein
VVRAVAKAPPTATAYQPQSNTTMQVLQIAIVKLEQLFSRKSHLIR